MRLFIAEKPSVAKAIVNELGVVKRNNGYIECAGQNYVTWCFGHLLEQAEPDAYTAEDIPVSKKTGKKIWRMEDLPIFPSKWKLLPKSDKGVKAQLKVIKTLIPKAQTIVNCGDPDREGQLLVDEILEFYGNKKPVLRFWVSAQDSASIRKGLGNLQPNSKYNGMKLAALGRQRADWLLGMNLTRALTLAHSSREERRLIAVGRVQTPTLQLVASRDLAIKNFKSIPFYNFNADIKVAGGSFKATWKAAENQKGLDESGRLVSKEAAIALKQKLQQAKSGVITKAEEVLKKQVQPKAYSLADIQLEASNKFGFSAQETLDTCQSLYENHKCASYPRSDCQFLPESQFDDAPSVIAAVAKSIPDLAALAKKANPSIKSPTWNDKKITAHHGIIPTCQSVSWEALNEKEKKIYFLIAKRYLSQFFPEHQYLAKTIELDIAGEKFTAHGKTVKVPGWKSFNAEEEKEDLQELPKVSKGERAAVEQISVKQDLTKPPAYFTEGTLIAAMEKIHTIVENPEHKKLLKEGDGIGTPATRAAIITELKKKGYLAAKGKKINATEVGFALLKVVPELVKKPVLTAMFERKLKEVEIGSGSLQDFLNTQQKFILQEISKAKKLAGA